MNIKINLIKMSSYLNYLRKDTSVSEEERQYSEELFLSNRKNTSHIKGTLRYYGRTEITGKHLTN